MKYMDLLNNILELKVRWKEIPTMTQLAKETWVSKVAIHHNFKSLLEHWYIKKVWYWKYDLNYGNLEIYSLYNTRRLQFLEQIYDDYEAVIVSNEEFERSNLELRKSNEFYKNQNLIMDWIIKSQQERIKHLEKVIQRPRYKRIFNFK